MNPVKTVVLCLLMNMAASASAQTNLANKPLAASATESVPPNIYFVLDNSASMSWAYMPDYVGYGTSNKTCQTGSEFLLPKGPCRVGDPPFSTNDFNRTYYNPAARYYPPKYPNGTDWSNASTTAPLNDPFHSSTFNAFAKSYTDDSTISDLVPQDLVPASVTQPAGGDLSSKWPSIAWCSNSTRIPGENSTAQCDRYPVYDPNDSSTIIANYPRLPVKEENGSYKRTSRVVYFGAPEYYLMEGAVFWCDQNNKNCVSQYDAANGKTQAKFDGIAEVAGKQANGYVRVSQTWNRPGTYDIYYRGAKIAQYTLANNELASNTTAYRNALAKKIRDAIDGKAGLTAVYTAEVTIYGNTCMSSQVKDCPKVTIYAPGSAGASNNTDHDGEQVVIHSHADFTLATKDTTPGSVAPPVTVTLDGAVDHANAIAGASFKRILIKSGQTYTKYPARSDCTGASCTYSEELQNFANWYSYYRTRILMMKTVSSRVFHTVDDRYRLGFSTIHNLGVSEATVLPIDASQKDSTTWKDIPGFLAMRAADNLQKQKWFGMLYNILAPASLSAGANTPLLGALSKAGRYFAGELTAPANDPITHSCQRNFTILTTDGMWNWKNDDAAVNLYNKPIGLGGASIGNVDGVADVPRPSFDASGAVGTLADIAYYYYHTDLRTATGDPKAVNDVLPTGNDPNVDDVATHQHMTTFTLGLGVDGALRYVSDYKTNASTGNDYYNILQGTVNWPDPDVASFNGDLRRIDDLWHAAVNGRGTYFSAQNSGSLELGLRSMLQSISMSVGAGAAAATSNLEPVAGDNLIFMGSYRSVLWDGDLAAHYLNLGTGQIEETPVWRAGVQLATRIDADGQADGRNIQTWDGTASNRLKPFTWAGLGAAEQVAFNNDVTNLSQYADRAADMNGQRLVAYLRGQDRYENRDRSADYGAYARLFRSRKSEPSQTILGDLVHSQPVYVKKSPFAYLDSGHSAFVAAQQNRPGTVYVGANDGMLHAFDAGTGNERWAYVPKQLLRQMWRLADFDYPDNHRYLIDATPTVADIKVSGQWKTILVGGFGKGANGYYALDITDPTAPAALWNFDDSNDSGMGYSFGSAIITKLKKRAEGEQDRWVVVVASGYNNTGNAGHVWVLDAGTGAVIRKLDTNSGSDGAPAGLAHLTAWQDNASVNNETQYVYGGDLNGKVWRFDITATEPGEQVGLVADLGASQPVTVPIELGAIGSERVLFFGTGRYLGESDVNSHDVQAIYAIKDKTRSVAQAAVANLVLREQVLMDMDSARRTTKPNQTKTNWATDDGWKIVLPDTGERVNVPAILQLGVLIVASNVPESMGCAPGGYGWVYQLDPKSGTFIETRTDGVAGWRQKGITVGMNVVKLPDGRVILLRTAHDDPKPKVMDVATIPGVAGGIRINWREILE